MELKSRRKTQFYLGFTGLFSLLGFRYFSTGEVSSLSYLGFLGYFAYFWISRISVSIPDERYYENTQKAKAFSFNFAILELAALFLLALFLPGTPLIFAVTICFASLPIIYGAKLYWLEER